jgi:hypothetical protein
MTASPRRPLMLVETEADFRYGNFIRPLSIGRDCRRGVTARPSTSDHSGKQTSPGQVRHPTLSRGYPRADRALQGGKAERFAYDVGSTVG